MTRFFLLTAKRPKSLAGAQKLGVSNLESSVIKSHLCFSVSLRREADYPGKQKKIMWRCISLTRLRGSFIWGQWPRMELNTYIKREGIRELQAVASPHNTVPAWGAVIRLFLTPQAAAFPEENRFLLLPESQSWPLRFICFLFTAIHMVFIFL